MSRRRGERSCSRSDQIFFDCGQISWKGEWSSGSECATGLTAERFPLPLWGGTERVLEECKFKPGGMAPAHCFAPPSGSRAGPPCGARYTYVGEERVQSKISGGKPFAGYACVACVYIGAYIILKSHFAPPLPRYCMHPVRKSGHEKWFITHT